MNVLLIGSGGREHALAYGISKSPDLEKLYAAPGNPGIGEIAENVQLQGNKEIVKFCIDKNIGLVVIGPEKPLVDGLADALRENNIPVFGPGKVASDIEAHKTFAKQLMQKYNIPTASFSEFSSAQQDEACEYLRKVEYPIVIKADGLAAGKGVLICNSVEEAIEGIDSIFGKKVFGKAGDKIIIEEFLKGQEASVFAITDGRDFVCLPAAQDHKRAHDGDTGRNTGGMGAYAPAPLVTNKIMEKVEEKILKPVLEAMKKEGREFIGCLYAGLMIENEEPKVVEFNCRFGDPETQVVVPLLKGNFLRLLYTASTSRLDKSAVEYSGESAVCVVAASHGYPEFYDSGFEILGLEQLKEEGILVFQAGTKIDRGTLVTSGGRVLGLTAVDENNDLTAAKQKAYEALRKIHYENIYYRTDISDKAFIK